MSTQLIVEKFEELYKKTYEHTLKYIIIHCSKIDDANDIIQDTYVELYKNIKKKKMIIENEQSYVIGIANNIMKKYYRRKYKEKNNVSIFENNEEEIHIQSETQLEMEFITKDNVKKIWEYLITKDEKIAKIFYLYYGVDMKITDIAKELQINESTIKNYIYRTIRELKKEFCKESD